MKSKIAKLFGVFLNLPAGLSASGATISGTATSTEDNTVTVTVTKGSYSDSKTYTFASYGIAISNTSLPSVTYNYNGCSYSATLGVTKRLPSETGKVTYYASGLPSGLSLNSSTGVISGTPTASGITTVSVYAKQGEYTSATKSLRLVVNTPPVPVISSSYSLGVSRSQLTSTSSVGQTVSLKLNGASYAATVFLSGSNFSYAVPQFTDSKGTKSYSWDVTLRGNESTTITSFPKITITASIVSDSSISLSAKLSKRTTLALSSLQKRGITPTSFELYNYDNTKNYRRKEQKSSVFTERDAEAYIDYIANMTRSLRRIPPKDQSWSYILNKILRLGEYYKSMYEETGNEIFSERNPLMHEIEK